MSDLIVRPWNGTPISRRPSDGYVNATAMCKANGKLWGHFFETDRCSQYLEALSGVIGKTISGPDGLVHVKKGGSDQGTWVHPDVATELARWISPEFSVFVNQWFREEFEARSEAPKPEPLLLNPQDTLDIIERSYNLLERFGVADDRDRLQFGDMVRNTTARAAGGLLLAPAEEEMTISDAWLQVTGEPLHRKLASKVGKLIAQKYRDDFDAEPPKRTQFVDGAPRKVNSYVGSWLLGAVHYVWNKLTGRPLPASA